MTSLIRETQIKTAKLRSLFRQAEMKMANRGKEAAGLVVAGGGGPHIHH